MPCATVKKKERKKEEEKVMTLKRNDILRGVPLLAPADVS